MKSRFVNKDLFFYDTRQPKELLYCNKVKFKICEAKKKDIKNSHEISKKEELESVVNHFFTVQKRYIHSYSIIP